MSGVAQLHDRHSTPRADPAPTRRQVLAALAGATTAGVAATLAGCTPTGRRNGPTTPASTPPSSTPAVPNARWTAAPAAQSSGSAVFGPGSEFTRSVRGAPLAANSARVSAVFRDSVAARRAGFNFHTWGVAFYTVAAGAPRHPVRFGDCFNSGTQSEPFRQAMSAVPIPSGAQPAPGTDRHMAIYDPHTRQLWEMWRASWTAEDGWTACWGGRIDHTDTAPGYFSQGTGAAATGIALSGVMVTIAEARAGRIRHAVGITCPTSAKGRFSHPAQRTDGGSTAPDVPLEGQRFRLDPSLDVSTLDLTPIAAMIARAAQEYGFILVDRSDAVGVVAESALPEILKTGADPWEPLLNVASVGEYHLLDNFPWDRLQALPPDWGKP